MQVQLLQKASYARCYKCGITDVEYICHHCGRPMCNSHTLYTSVIRNKAKNESSNNPLNNPKKLLSKEFTKLNLSDTECGEEPYHCSDCIHIVRGVAWKRILIGSILVLMSLVAIPNNRLATKLLVLFMGGGLVTYGVYASIQRKKQAHNKKPPLPVIPSFDKVQIRETLKGRINLESNGNYEVEVFSSQGQLDIDLSLKSEDYERLEKYYRPKYGLAENFHAGFVVLKGAIGIKFTEDVLRNRINLNYNSTVIPLIDLIETQPLLKGFEERNAQKKHITLTYNLQEVPDGTTFPIQLVLSFLPETDKQGLEIGVQWTELEVTDNYKTQLRKLQISQIELLELKFPVSWGRIKNFSQYSKHLIRLLSACELIVD